MPAKIYNVETTSSHPVIDVNVIYGTEGKIKGFNEGSPAVYNVTFGGVEPSLGDAFLLEDGSYLLKEDGGKMLIEVSPAILLESGDYLLLETGSLLLVE